ncbi:hypothetical protein NADE_001706 [Nannochloris sp. 'desiccata']|nr:hypothetical protein NADE_001706 [Chlorella desiccata (nom. nud.)]
MVADGPTSPRARGKQLDPAVKVKLDQFLAERSCSRKESEEIHHQLTTLAPSDALDALDKLESALRTSNVRNMAAYLSGVVRRITQLSPSGHDGAAALPPLFPEAQSVLDYLYHAGTVRRGDIDSKQLMTLSKKSPEYQVLVMDTFRDRNLRGIRNMAAFFSSHQSQVEKDLRDNKLRLPRLGGPPPPARHPLRYPPPQDVRDDRAPYDSQYHPEPHPHHHQHGPPPPHLQGAGGPPPYGAPPAQYHPQPASPGQHRGGGGGGPPLYGGPPPSSLSMGMGAMPPPTHPLPPKHYAIEQGQWGIRIDEFQNLSPFAKYVHPATALRLQQLWDVEQNKLVSLLNEASWESLAGLDAVNGVAAVNECAEAMKTAGDDLITINGIFLRIALKFPKRVDAPTLATIALAAADAAAVANIALPSLLPLIGGAGGMPPPQQQQEQYVPGSVAPGEGRGPYGALLPQQGYQPSGGPPSPYGSGAPPSYGGPPPSAAPQPPVQLPGQLGALPPVVQGEIDSILRRWGGLLKLEHFEGRPCDIMHAIGENASVRALEDFGRNDPKSMRSPTAYLIGCLKKFGGDREDGGGRSRGGRGGGRGDRDGGGRGRGRGGGGRGRGGRSPPRNYAPY